MSKQAVEILIAELNELHAVKACLPRATQAVASMVADQAIASLQRALTEIAKSMLLEDEMTEGVITGERHRVEVGDHGGPSKRGME